MAQPSNNSLTSLRYKGQLCSALFCVSLLLTFSAFAQSAKLNSRGECVGSMPEANGDSALPESFFRKRRDLSKELELCTQSAVLLEKRLDHEKIRLIDIRSVVQRNSAPIQGALTIGPVDLSRKSLWQDKAIALIGSGSDDDETLRYCAELRAAGFTDLTMLPGGEQRLRDLGNRGDQLQAFARTNNRVSPVTIIRNHRSVQWRVIDFSKNTDAHALQRQIEQLHGTAQVVSADDVDNALQLLVKHVSEEGNDTRLNKKTVLTGLTEPALSKAVRKIRKETGAEVYYLPDAAEALAQQEASHAAIRRYEPVLTHIGGCGGAS